jgi:hypothetical protein
MIASVFWMKKLESLHGGFLKKVGWTPGNTAITSISLYRNALWIKTANGTSMSNSMSLWQKIYKADSPAADLRYLLSDYLQWYVSHYLGG